MKVNYKLSIEFLTANCDLLNYSLLNLYPLIQSYQGMENNLKTFQNTLYNNEQRHAIGKTRFTFVFLQII